MHLFHIPQCNIQNRNVHISVLNVALWDMEQVHCGISELGQLYMLNIHGEIVKSNPLRKNWSYVCGSTEYLV